jgi:hypothetical protein
VNAQASLAAALRRANSSAPTAPNRRLRQCGHTSVRNDAAKDGLWVLAGKRRAIYAREELTAGRPLQQDQAFANERRYLED